MSQEHCTSLRHESESPRRLDERPPDRIRKLGQDRARLAVVEGIEFTLRLDPYLSLKALAAHSGLSVRKLREHLTAPPRPLPHYRIGAKIVVRRGEYDTWALRYRRVGDPKMERVVAEVLRDL